MQQPMSGVHGQQNDKASMRVNRKVLDVKCPYQPPYVEIICIETQGVFCYSAMTTDYYYGIEDMTIDTIRL